MLLMVTIFKMSCNSYAGGRERVAAWTAGVRRGIIGKGNQLKPIVVQGPMGPRIRVEGREYLFFGGTDYLGFAARPEVREGAHRAIDGFGISSSSSRSSMGTNELHLALEKAIGRFAGSRDAVIMGSGYLAMNSLLSGALEKGDLVLLQRDAHASIVEAVRARLDGWLEFDLDRPDRLAELIREKAPAEGRVVVVGEGVAPLFGRVFPLNEVLEVLSDHKHLVLLDDAHGFGVLGQRGRGTVEHTGCAGREVMACATLSKAFGTYGGCIPAERETADRIRSRSLVYQCSTPLPAPLAGAALAAFEYVEDHPEIFARLKANSRLLKAGLAEVGIPTDHPEVPIVPVCLGGAQATRRLSQRLFERGIIAPYSIYPGSPEGGMVRLAVSAAHDEEQIRQLVAAVKEVI